jgi:hypothetical protein
MHVAKNRSSRQSASRVSNPESIALIGTMLISRTAERRFDLDVRRSLARGALRRGQEKETV